ncbi:unnamed protein product [Calicophoron daubneyi]|uniref:Vacuole membrane protein 1 n=1 Tax=Calicophoron daubneyi TaxID=300641 RepID=A0AAV2TAY2_CALDB
MEVASRKHKVKPELNGTANHTTSRQSEKRERDQLVLWNSPFMTIYYFVLECIYRLAELRFTVQRHRRLFCSLMSCVSVLLILNFYEGPHSEVFQYAKKRFFWWSWWVWLGFLSSFGFGTGLHTFVLYLGPFIAEVTMSAYECGTLDFPSPPYPDRIICPETTDYSTSVSFWQIVRKVQLESILWGFGTAIGELPPYFMAKSARLSDRHEEELEELEELIASNQTAGSPSSPPRQSSTWKKRMEVFLHQLVIRAGFMGILLCASIPNPLFDLAGMTCGHFLVPFWYFFGATFIGKALIKVHLQQFSIIAISSEHHVDNLIELLGEIPLIGKRLQAPFQEYLQNQRASLHDKIPAERSSWLQTVIFFVVFGFICSFIVSIINAFAKSYHRRLCQWRRMASS